MLIQVHIEADRKERSVICDDNGLLMYNSTTI